MKLWISRTARVIVVLVGIILLTSFTIDATDSLNGSQSALSILAENFSSTLECPEGMRQIDSADHSYCIDVYENSFVPDCPLTQTSSMGETQQNINALDCVTQSVSNVSPAVFVTFHQAQNFCARRQARLPTQYEWYEAALGTPDIGVCNVDGSLSLAGVFSECVSARGIFDMIGNVWEWIDAEAVDQSYNDRPLPPTGFVESADRSGVALKTTTTPQILFNEDYFWSVAEGTKAMMRGGFYNSKSDGGIFAVHADLETSFSSGGIGFRCVTDL
jgi:hypothetical protein